MSSTSRFRQVALTLVALGGGAALAAPAMALSPIPSPITITDRPAYVQVTVELSRGTVSPREGQVEALDPSVEDGRGSVLVTARGASVIGGQQTRLGVTANASVSRRGPLLSLRAASGRFAFVSYEASRGRTLVVRLWKSDPVFPGAIRRADACLRITAYAGTTGRVSARGLERRPLFEHGLVLQLRDAAGRSVGLRPITAREGTFRPDFSGYLRPGTWSGTVTHRVTRRQRGVLQAWVTSARDGSLECLVQVPVTLAPRAN